VLSVDFIEKGRRGEGEYKRNNKLFKKEASWR
jgi:hypothetical protein